jgi:outer membrane lipoprotein-sorting protein
MRALAVAALIISGCLLTIRVEGSSTPQGSAALPDVLKKSLAYYSTLTSYSDTGTVAQEIPGHVTNAKFVTYFRRASRDLYFDFQTLNYVDVASKRALDMSRYRNVIWMFKGEMETYSFYFRAHEIINAEGGGQVRAVQGASYATMGTSVLIPSLLYSQARMPSTILQVEQATVAGTEEIGKRLCHKVTGIAAAYYPSGQRTSVRPVTIWIDVESQLIRRVLEDTPKGGAAGSLSRLTINYDEPQANPAIDDSKFHFNVPIE